MGPLQILHSNDQIEITTPTAIALGFFDGVHLGHAAVIGAAKKTGLKTVVLTFSEHPLGKKVERITGDELKNEALATLGVDTVVYLDFPKIKDMTPEQFVNDILVGQYRAAFVACGFNYHFGRGAVADSGVLEKLCDQHDVKTACVRPVFADDPGVCAEGLCPHLAISSTLIRRLVRQGSVQQANACLGRPYAIYGEVIGGRQLGRTMGMPTINQRIEPGYLQPRFGVYAAFVCVDGRRLPAVANIGLKPTVGSDYVLAETHIFDYSADLYGRHLKVELIEFIRDEVKFDDLAGLKKQMENDRVRAHEITSSFLSQTPSLSPSHVSPALSVCGHQTL